MSWTRYLLHDFWTARELNRIDERERAKRRAERNRQRREQQERRVMGERIADLEQELGEATLLLRALTELCLEKGVLTAEELSDRAERLDLLDGVADGRIGEPPAGDGPVS